MATAASEKILNLDPARVLVVPEDNPRYGAPMDVQSLADAISAEGGINTPVEVEKLKGDPNYDHRLTVGFRRYAALQQLNANGANLTLPAIVRDRGDALARLRTQISENHDRRSLSPMDYGVIIKRLLDSGVPRIEIREMFPRATSATEEGGKPEPASNSWLNMMMSFLDLPEDIRAKIHDGRLPVKAAYTLTRVPPERRAAVLAKAEEEQNKELKREHEEEQKLIALQEKIDGLSEQEAKAALEIDAAKQEAEAAKAKVTELQQKARDAYEAFQAAGTEAAMAKDKEAREAALTRGKEASERLKALQTDVTGAQKALVTADGKVNKLEQARSKVSTSAADLKAKLETAQAEVAKAPKKAKEGVTTRAITDAAAAEGTPVGIAKLNVAQIRKFVSEISLLGNTYPKVAQIGAVLLKLFDGTGEPDSVAYGKATKELAAIVGEFQAAPKTAPKPPTPPVPPVPPGKGKKGKK